MTITPYAPPQSNAVAVPSQPDLLPQKIAKLAEWAQAAQAIQALAEGLVRTSFVPAAFRGKPMEATAAILAGTELGFDPMASLRSFDVIQGIAAPRAITLRAVVQSKGHEIWEEETTATKAIVCGRRKGSDKVRRSEWDLDRAQGLDLLGKDNWKKQPGAMLLARATSEVCRLVAADAILGIPYSSEEIIDAGTAFDGGAVPSITRVTAAEIMQAVEAAPAAVVRSTEPDSAASDADEVGDTGNAVGMVTRKQQNEMFALWNDLGHGGDENRAMRLQVTTKILGLTEPLESSNDLTEAEADLVIGALRARKAAQNGGGS